MVGFLYIFAVILLPVCVCTYFHLKCEDVSKCEKCPISCIFRDRLHCKFKGVPCNTVHFCKTRRWIK